MRSGTSSVGGRHPGPSSTASTTHHASHDQLLRDASQFVAPSPGTRHARPDAIIVPATRRASALSGLVELAAALGSTIVVLCSRQTKIDQMYERIKRTVGVRGVVVQIDEDYGVPDLHFETASASVATISGGRNSDLSVKRNVGLLLARMRDWRKIVFVDDDITLSLQNLARIAVQLDHHQIAGMACREFSDNSVLCHARRLAKLPQGIFVTGAALGVNCGDLPLPFFPDVYNEDWFFFAEAAARRHLTKVGEARQAEYDPYAEPARASHEEFGDLLAEGLYSLIEKLPISFDPRRPADHFPALIRMATEKFWATTIDVRRQNLHDTRIRLESFTEQNSCSDVVFAALTSLAAADKRYDDWDNPITAQRCVSFLEAWRRDIVRWNRVYQGTTTAQSTADALRRLDIATWTSIR